MVFRLFVRSLRLEKGRFFCAVCAVAASVGLLAWNLALVYSAASSGRDAAKKYLSPYCAFVSGSPARAAAGRGAGGKKSTVEATAGRRFHVRKAPLPMDLAGRIASSPKVESVTALSVVPVSMDFRPGGRVLQGPPFVASLCTLPEGGMPFGTGLSEGRLPSMDGDECEAVMDGSLFSARVPRPKIGTVVPLLLPKGVARVKLTGFFESRGLVLDFPQLYCNGALARVVSGMLEDDSFPGKANLLLVKGRGITDADLSSMVGGARGGLSYGTAQTLSERFRSDTVKNFLSAAPLNLSLAFLSAAALLSTLFAIGLALSRRKIAELRSLGMTKRQALGGVLAEGGFAVFAGWLLGLSAALALAKIYLLVDGEASGMGRSLAPGCETVLYSFLFAFSVWIFSSAVPLSIAAGISPVEAFCAPPAEVKPFSAKRAAVSLLLLLPLPVMSHFLPVEGKFKAWCVALAGLPSLVASMVLGAETLLQISEAAFARPVASLLSLDPSLLRHRVARGRGRVVGTVLSVSLGLGSFIAIHVWGGTLMSSFVPSPEWPDAIVSVLPGGLGKEDVQKIRELGIAKDAKVLEMDAMERPFGGEGRPTGNVLLIGVDPVEAFGGDKPFAPMKFAAEDRATALKEVSEGRGCIMVSMLSRLSGLEAGDFFDIDGRRLKVSATVDLNWHLVTSRAQLRTAFGGDAANGKRRNRRTIGAVFVSEGFVRESTGNSKSHFLWLDFAPELEKYGALRASAIASDRISGAISQGSGNIVRVHHRDEIADGTLSRGNNIIGTMARIPFWSLIVTSSGMAALLFASVRSSKREFETMRAVGARRRDLAAIIAGEAILVSLAAVVLSLAGGIVAGWSFTGLSHWMLSAGLERKLAIPFAAIGKGVLFALLLSLAMSLLPIRSLLSSIGKETQRDV